MIRQCLLCPYICASNYPSNWTMFYTQPKCICMCAWNLGKEWSECLPEAQTGNYQMSTHHKYLFYVLERASEVLSRWNLERLCIVWYELVMPRTKELGPWEFGKTFPLMGQTGNWQSLLSLVQVWVFTNDWSVCAKTSNWMFQPRLLTYRNLQRRSRVLKFSVAVVIGEVPSEYVQPAWSHPAFSLSLSVSILSPFPWSPSQFSRSKLREPWRCTAVHSMKWVSIQKEDGVLFLHRSIYIAIVCTRYEWSLTKAGQVQGLHLSDRKTELLEVDLFSLWSGVLMTSELGNPLQFWSFPISGPRI